MIKTYELPNTELRLELDFPSVETPSLSNMDNVDGPPTKLNSHYMIIPGRKKDGVVGAWQGRILNDGLDVAIYDYLNNDGAVWSWDPAFCTRDYPFCWNFSQELDPRYRVFTQREIDYTDINNGDLLPPTYSQVVVHSGTRVSSDHCKQVNIMNHWQTVEQCCYINESTQNLPGQMPTGIKGDVLVHTEQISDEIILIYYTRIMDIRNHNYNKDFEHGYPDHIAPLIEPPDVGAGDWHRPNLCVAEYNTKTNKISKYYNGEFIVTNSFSTNDQYDSALLDRPAMYGRMVRYEDFLIYISQSWENNGFHIFTTEIGDYLNWNYELTIPIKKAYHPHIISMDNPSDSTEHVLYFCKDRDLEYTFGLRAVKCYIS